MLYGGRVETVHGNPLRFVRWEPALRAMYHGRPVYDAARVDLHGFDPDRARSRPTTSRPTRRTMRDFLETCGYVLVRDVFSPEEVSGFLDDAAVLRDEAREGDKMSWWGKDASGATVLCRVLRAASRPRSARAARGSARARAR